MLLLKIRDIKMQNFAYDYGVITRIYDNIF